MSETEPRPMTWATGLESIARQFTRDEAGWSLLSTGARARLRRFSSEHWADALADLMPVLMRASLPVEKMNERQLRRWALVVHVIAILAGTTGRAMHSRARRAGEVFQQAGYAEARFMRLTTAHGAALEDQIIRLARFLAAKSALPLDLRPLASLLLHDGAFEDNDTADRARLDLARGYYSPPRDKSAPSPTLDSAL